MGLTPFEEAHARSIVEVPAVVEPIPPLRRYRILVGSAIRKTAPVVHGFLQTLAWQRLRAPLDLSFHFITDYAHGEGDLEILSLLDAFAKNHDTKVVHHQNQGGDYGEGEQSRRWEPTAWHRVGELKNSILQRTLTEKFDACWLVDADVLNDPTALQSLWDADEPIVSAVYWTHWQKPNRDSGELVRAGPQVWLRHPYILHGRGFTEPGFRDALIRRQKVRVWGLGANTLIRAGAIAKGCSFARIGDLPPGPMADGEDRHFCRRADALHIPMYADAWPDVYHAYHPQDYGMIPQRLIALGQPHPVQASIGDLVSVVVRNLEQPDLGPEWVRGRLGSLGVVPEIEEAVARLTVGDSQLVRVHFPVHYALSQLAGQTRILSVTLNDVKPYHLPPTIEAELLLGARAGSTVDLTTLNDAQVEDALADAACRS